MKYLDAGYNVNFRFCDQKIWHEIIKNFLDASLYQMPAYDTVRFGQKGIMHMILKRGDTIVAAAQVRLMMIPLIKKGIAYVFWGPLWKLLNAPEEVDIFRQAVRALRNEFSLRRGHVLRIYPMAFAGRDSALKQILMEEGFTFFDDGKSHRTLIVDLLPSLGEMRAAFDQKWRNCLNRAEKNNLEVISGTDEALFDEIMKIYIEMANRKGLKDLSNIEHLKKAQEGLPPEFKLQVILCRLEGQVCAGAIFAAVGTSAVYLIGATSNAGMKSNGSYLIQWSFLKWLKENGFSFYNLNGINPAVNPGTYHFKRGLAGKKGIDLEFLGKYQVADNPVSALLVNGGEKLVSGLQMAKGKIKTLRSSNT